MHLYLLKIGVMDATQNTGFEAKSNSPEKNK